MDINFSKKKVYPSKQYLNLAVKEKNGIDAKVAIPAIIAVLVLVGLFAKFAIMDRFAKVEAAQTELTNLKLERSVINAKLEDYDATVEEYKKYSVSWMDDIEKALVLKTDMIDLINSEILKNSETRSISISGNTISAQLVGLSLTDTSALIDRLYARPDVQDVQMFTATTEEAVGGQVIVSLLVTMKQEENDDAGETAEGGAAE